MIAVLYNCFQKDKILFNVSSLAFVLASVSVLSMSMYVISLNVVSSGIIEYEIVMLYNCEV